MKKWLFSGLVLALSAGSAQTIEFNTPESWTRPRSFKWTEANGEKVLAVTKESWPEAAGEMIEIKPDSLYELSADFRTDAAKPGFAELGFWLYDENKKPISYQHVGGRLSTDTVLAEPCKKDDKIIHVQSAKKWIPGGGCVAFDVPSFLDEPFTNVVAGIGKITHFEHFSTIELKNPVRKDYPAGTRIRQHVLGFHFYCWRGRIANEWKTYSGRVQGQSKDGVQPGKWWPKAKYFKVRFAVNLNSPEATTFIRNFQLKIVRESYL